MINKLMIMLVLLAAGLSGCSQNALQERRKGTMLLITDCIQQNDTVQLWKLIDTSFDKEGLTYDISFLHRQFVKIKAVVGKNDFKISAQNKEYYHLRVQIRSKTIDYIDVNFLFSPLVSNRVVTMNKNVETLGDDLLKPHVK